MGYAGTGKNVVLSGGQPEIENLLQYVRLGNLLITVMQPLCHGFATAFDAALNENESSLYSLVLSTQSHHSTSAMQRDVHELGGEGQVL